MKQTKLLANIFYLWKYLGKKRRLHFVGLFILMMVSVFAEIVSIGAVVPFLSALSNPDILMQASWFQPIIQCFDIETKEQLLLPLTTGFVGIAMVAAAMRVLLLWSNTRLSTSMGIELRSDIYARTLYRPYAYHLSHNSSQLISMVTEKVGLTIQAGIMHVLLFVSALIVSMAIIVTLLFINATVAMVTFFVLGGGYVLIGYLVKQKIKQNGEIIARNQPDAVKCMQEGLGGIRDIILDNSQNIFIKLYTKVATQSQIAAMQNAFLGGVPKSLLEVLGIILISFLAYYLQTNADEEVAVLPMLGALALGAQRLLPSLQQMYFSWTMIHENQANLESVITQLSFPLPSTSETHKSYSALKFEHTITLKDISFKYEGTENTIFTRLNLTIDKGTRVGFIGETGSGKSTLLDIVMGLLLPIEGRLSVDGVEIDTQNINAWQSHIAHVPQSIFLTDASILENIAFGIPTEKIDKEKVKQAAQQASLDDFIEGLPLGYETTVGERGVQLSGGQRQRIGIARALYKQASLIVLDEATSALDDKTEESVMRAVNALDKDLTLLIIAHRLSTLKECDVIYRLDKGSIVASGTYEEIVNAV